MQNAYNNTKFVIFYKIYGYYQYNSKQFIKWQRFRCREERILDLPDYFRERSFPQRITDSHHFSNYYI